MPPGLNEMVVESVRVHMLSSQHVVILKDLEHDRYLPIWIGTAEADAIARRLQGITPERPLTHDLFASTLEELGVAVKQVVVSDLADETFRARLILQLADRTVDVDARPRAGRRHAGAGRRRTPVGLPRVRELARHRPRGVAR
jgi:hypothetical protein